jgi:putative SOS response-associated peptidase YedK
MCGRYTIFSLREWIADLPWAELLPDVAEPVGRYNIAPTQTVPIVTNSEPNRFTQAHWGLVPGWAKDTSIAARLINARSETLAEKPSFRTALKRRRCLVPTSGFFEWQLQPDGKTKQPYFISLADGKPFAFAGLWETWSPPTPPSAGGELVSCTIITTEPNALMRTLHTRMPVILPREKYAAWLGEGADVGSLLVPFDAQAMVAHPVAKAVGNVRFDSPENVMKV